MGQAARQREIGHGARHPAYRPASGAVDEPRLADLRFRQLLGQAAWASLPAAVRDRFGKHLGPGASTNYAGQVLYCRMSRAGWCLAQACRLIGAPLPLERTGGAAVVSVTEDARSGGQVWTRLYARKAAFPQVIHSTKRFAGHTGLEEYLGAGFGIALQVSALAHGIRFASDHYFLCIGHLRLRLPAWLAPGQLMIDHVDCDDAAFTFTLTLVHPLLGEMMCQHSQFRDQAPHKEFDHA